jgi:hypothetical protein
VWGTSAVTRGLNTCRFVKCVKYVIFVSFSLLTTRFVCLHESSANYKGFIHCSIGYDQCLSGSAF